MKLPPYPRYKDSGVDWLGKVPEHWRVKRFKYLFTPSDERNGESVVGEMLSVSGYRGIVVKEYEDENQKRTEENLRDYRVVRPGQLVVNTMWLNYAGLGVSRFEGHVSPAYRSYYISEEINGWFAHHLLRSSVYVSGYTKYLQGIRPNSLQIKTEEFHSLPVLLPLVEEQTTIAKFLDHETTKIDTLIGKQERLIALLQEKMRALISHAVIKGLNPNAPMKESGIEWLGIIPEHWKVKPLKLCIKDGTSISYGIVQPGDNIQDGIPFVQTTNMTTGDFNLDRLQRTSSEIEKAYPRSRICAGDVMLGIRASIGAAHVVPEHLTGSNLSRGVARIVLNSEIQSDYFVSYLRSSQVNECWKLGLQGSTFNEVSIATVRELFVIIPPKHEQQAIVAYINHETTRITALISKAYIAVELMKEHRIALISAAVTGKIDVRQYKNGNLSNH